MFGKMISAKAGAAESTVATQATTKSGRELREDLGEVIALMPVQKVLSQRCNAIRCGNTDTVPCAII